MPSNNKSTIEALSYKSQMLNDIEYYSSRLFYGTQVTTALEKLLAFDCPKEWFVQINDFPRVLSTTIKSHGILTRRLCMKLDISVGTILKNRKSETSPGDQKKIEDRKIKKENVRKEEAVPSTSFPMYKTLGTFKIPKINRSAATSNENKKESSRPVAPSTKDKYARSDRTERKEYSKDRGYERRSSRDEHGSSNHWKSKPLKRLNA